MLLADEYEELEQEREAFAQENKFSKAKSASPTQVTFRRCEETGNKETRGIEQWSPPHRVPRQHATGAPGGGQWTPPHQQQRQPTNTVWRPPSTAQRPHETTHITDPRRPAESAAVTDTGCGDVDTNASAAELRAGVARCYFSKLTGKLIEEEQQ